MDRKAGPEETEAEAVLPATRKAEGRGRRAMKTTAEEEGAAVAEERRSVGFGVHPLVGGARMK